MRFLQFDANANLDASVNGPLQEKVQLYHLCHECKNNFLHIFTHGQVFNIHFLTMISLISLSQHFIDVDSVQNIQSKVKAFVYFSSLAVFQ